MRRLVGALIGLLVFVLLAAALLYASRYWTFRLWSREGLAGVEALRPQGDIVTQQLRGTRAAPFALVLWGIGGFLVLTFVNWLWTLVGRWSRRRRKR